MRSREFDPIWIWNGKIEAVEGRRKKYLALVFRILKKKLVEDVRFEQVFLFLVFLLWC